MPTKSEVIMSWRNARVSTTKGPRPFGDAFTVQHSPFSSGYGWYGFGKALHGRGGFFSAGKAACDSTFVEQALSAKPSNFIAEVFDDLLLVFLRESVGAKSDGFADLYKALKNLSMLKPGWDGDDAEAPNAMAVNRARRVLDRLFAFNLKPSRVVASADGGVGLLFSGKERRYADIECLNTGEMLAVTSDRVSEPQVWTIGADSSLEDSITRISSFINA